jgi:FtsP/CotA-like multicopper oxidase with cupredoxin domain
MDGVPGVQQCPIPPGGVFTYTFTADLYGTSWYHSHYTAQYASGLFGPMVIYGPNATAYDIDVGPVLLTDHFHDTYEDLLPKIVTTNINDIVSYPINKTSISSQSLTRNRYLSHRITI